MVDRITSEKGYDSIGGAGISSLNSGTFSLDSKRVAYIASQGEKWSVVVDETKSNEYEQSNRSFIGQKRIIWDSTDCFHYLVQKGNGVYLVEETIKDNSKNAYSHNEWKPK